MKLPSTDKEWLDTLDKAIALLDGTGPPTQAARNALLGLRDVVAQKLRAGTPGYPIAEQAGASGDDRVIGTDTTSPRPTQAQRRPGKGRKRASSP